MSQIVKLALACAWDGKLQEYPTRKILFAYYYFPLSWLSKRPPVRSRWLNLLMNVFNLFAEDDEVKIIELCDPVGIGQR